jgi:methionine-R-sulfoxide reductase
MRNTMLLACVVGSIALGFWVSRSDLGHAAQGPGATTAPTTQRAAQLAKWKQELPELTYSVMFENATERAFSHPFHDQKKKGIYVSAATGEPLFSSDDKFDSGTGWPSFTRPIRQGVIGYHQENDRWQRIEVRDLSSDGHLGHVFDDGPAPTGKRYCINGAALRFVPAQAE